MKIVKDKMACSWANEMVLSTEDIPINVWLYIRKHLRLDVYIEVQSKVGAAIARQCYEIR